MTSAPRPQAGQPLWPAALLIGTGLLGLALLLGGAQAPSWGPPLIGPGGGGGMADLHSGPTVAGARPLPDTELRRRLEAFAASRWPASTLQGVMPFADNTYAVVTDPASGQGLAEVLVDRCSGAVGLEPGPNMVWNVRSGQPGRWMGAPARLTSIGEADARARAATFLTTYLPGAKVRDGHTLAGYYTFDYVLGNALGMLSVNARTGEVWRHTWHGLNRPAARGSR